jgi:chromosome segregation ATPase
MEIEKMNKEQEESIDTFFWDVLPKDWAISKAEGKVSSLKDQLEKTEQALTRLRTL